MRETQFVDRPRDLPMVRTCGSPLKTLPEVMLDRRATAHFRHDPVPEEYLAAILSLAAQAPSGFNLQPWRFVVVRDEERRRALQGAAMDQPKVGEAPVIVVAFGRFEGWRTHMDAILKEGVRRGAGDPDGIDKQKNTVIDFLGNFPPAVWINRHVMIAVTTMMLVAETYGIDTAPMEGFDPAAVRQVCQLPEDAEIVALLAMGFAQEPDKPYGGRLALEEFVHDETFGKPWMPLD